jgi:uncharacterized protein
MEEDFVFPLNGLTAGKTQVSRTVGKKFFNSFENSEILDADLDVDITIEKSGQYIGVDAHIEGNVTVLCDRCLEDLSLPVATTVKLSVKFGEEPAVQDEFQEGEREIIFLPESDSNLDLSQIVYDYTCLSLPMQRIHEDGKCNPSTVKYLSSEDRSQSDDDSNPFSKLKELIKDKK